MEPEIRYCATSDGASIAYAAMGAGPIVIMLPSVYGFARLRDIPWLKVLCDAIAGQFRLVRYDGRGMGLSAREHREYDLEARLKDLEAVIDAIGAETFALHGFLYGGFAAMTYAARHPQRVSRLVLADALSSGERFFTENPIGRVNAALGTITAEQWEFVTDTIAARGTAAESGPDAIRAVGAVLRETWAPADFLAHREALRGIDVSGDLATIVVPTLVVSTTQTSAVFEHSRELASAIPNARLLRVNGRWTGWDGGDYDTLLAFLGGTAQPAEAGWIAPRIEVPHGTAVILFADIVDSTALTEKVGDAAFRAQARDLDEAMRLAIRDCGGTPVDGKLLGDGVLAVFTSAREAIDAALRCAASGEAGGLPLHLGLHAGDVIREEGNVYGGAVNIAARISAFSAPGEVLVSDIVRGLARTSASVFFEDRGEHTLKGVSDAHRLFAVTRRA